MEQATFKNIHVEEFSGLRLSFMGYNCLYYKNNAAPPFLQFTFCRKCLQRKHFKFPFLFSFSNISHPPRNLLANSLTVAKLIEFIKLIVCRRTVNFTPKGVYDGKQIELREELGSKRGRFDAKLHQNHTLNIRHSFPILLLLFGREK